MDWFPAVMTLVGLLVGVGVQELRFWRERKDKYRDMVFEKRVDAHQGAYYRFGRLPRFMAPSALMKDGGVRALAEELCEYEEWVSKNALYLDGGSRTKIHMFFGYAIQKAKKYKDEEWVKNIDVGEEKMELYKNMVEVQVAIRRGIGVEYLPEEKTPVDVSYLARILDEVVEGEEELIRREQKKREQKG